MEELAAISPVLAGMKRQLPFAAPPAGYFDELPAAILARVKASSSEKSLGLSEGSVGTNASLELQERSETAISPSEELQGLSGVLANMDKKLPFSVPEGYFEGLGSGILDKLRSGLDEEGISLPGNIREKNPYTIPENYFQEFPGKLLDKIKHSETAAATAPVDPATGDAARPESENRAPAKIIALPARPKWIRYAAAALVAGLIAGAGWIFMDNRSDYPLTGEDRPAVATSGNDQRGLTNVSPEEIGSLSAMEIGDYLETESLFLPDEAILAFADLSLNDLQDMLADIPDETLQNYLIQTGNVEERFNN